MRIVCLVLVLMAGALPLAGSNDDDHAASMRGMSQSASQSMPEFEWPRIAVDQTRPRVIQLTEGGLEPNQPDWGGGGSGGTCVWNRKCNGGAICATGECIVYEGLGCAYCSDSSKCKSCK